MGQQLEHALIGGVPPVDEIDYHNLMLLTVPMAAAYALFDPGRWEAVEVLRWLKEYVEEAQRQRV